MQPNKGFVFIHSFNFDIGPCPDSPDNLQAAYAGLPAGTYYVPVYSADDSSGLGQDYTMTVSIP